MRDFKPKSLSLDDKAVLVTGGTGSFGRKFIETVLALYKPKRLIVFSRDELKQYEMQQQFSQQKYPCMRYFIGDVRDRDRLTMAMRDVDIVIHAAAPGAPAEPPALGEDFERELNRNLAAMFGRA